MKNRFVSYLHSLKADFNPDNTLPPQQARTVRDRDYEKLRKMQSVWNFWKKKTGNYLANKFFENAEFLMLTVSTLL